MKISKTKAVKLFVALGLKNADKWNDGRLGLKLSKVREMVDEDVKLEPEEAATLAEVTAANEAGEEFEIESDGDPVQDAPAEQVEGEPKAEKAAKAPKKTDEEKAAEKAAKEKERADKAAEKARLKADHVKGRKRLRACGQVLRTHGMVDGSFVLKITPELVAEVDAIVGKTNPTQTEHSLAQAWSAIAGYFEDGK
jgi:hypothetical protein